MKNKKKLVKNYLFKVKYFLNDDSGDIIVDSFNEDDFNWIKGSGAIDVLEVQKIKRLLVR